jgi:hypothetical protein
MTAALRSALLCLAFAALAGIAGCTALSGLVNPAGRLLEQAREAVAQESPDTDTAWARLSELRTRHPDTPECREAFPLAAAIFKLRYLRDRHARPDSPFVTSAPRFMLEWLAAYLAGPEFPRAEVEALFIGMPYGYFRDYLAMAEGRPELARWALRAEDDNGIIDAIAPDGGLR